MRTVSTRLRALVELSRAVRAAMADERRLATQLAEATATQTGDAAVVWLRPADGGELACLATAHANPRTSDSFRAVCRAAGPGTGDGLVAAVLDSGLSVVLDAPDLVQDPAGVHPAVTPWLTERGAAGAAVVPLYAGPGQIVGVLLALRDRDGDGYCPDDVEYLTALADLAASALDSARLLADSAMAAEGLRRQSEWVDQVSDAIMTCDAEHRVLTWNTGAEITYQYSAAEAVGCDVSALLATRYYATAAQPLEPEAVFQILTATGRWSGELRQRRADGEEIELLCSLTELTDEEGNPVGWVTVNRDVTDERRKERAAMHDVLTGLPNRRFLLAHLGLAQQRSAQNGDRTRRAIHRPRWLQEGQRHPGT